MNLIKDYGFCAAAILAMTVAGTASAFDGGPALLTKAPERVFTPHGFDDNDNVQVVVDDELASTCYKAGPIKADIDYDSKVIRVTNHHYFYEGCWCAEVVTPYFRAVDLGVLGPGSYKVMVAGEEGKVSQKGTMAVSHSNTLAPDDYLYAPVSEVSVKMPTRSGDLPLLTLRGNFTNTCMHLKEVRPTYSPENVIEVLPIAEMGTENCRAETTPFSKTIALTNVPSGRTLIHVRSLNGQALNQVYSF